MEKVKDPVCGMEVDPAKTPHRTRYRGRTYHFCCPKCKEAFDREPEKYAERQG
jgi:Cu+-exporting ATPase